MAHALDDPMGTMPTLNPTNLEGNPYATDCR